MRCGRGATALEFALVAPLLLMLLLGTIDMARWAWAGAALHDAAARAARCVAVAPGQCTSRRGLAAAAQSSAITPVGAHFDLAHGACGHEVRAQLQFRTLVPLPASLRPILRAHACVP